MFQTGFILNRRDDLIWFIGLPLLATIAALAGHRWLPYVALASVTLWITIPHQFATWLRAYGHLEDWRRWKTTLIAGPAIIILMTVAGTFFAPLTLFLVLMLWDHQHSIMQQHGFARIYDFKAQSGSPSTRRFDLALHWILYGNLLATAPLFNVIWIRELYRWHLPISADGVRVVHMVSWTVLAVYGCVYIGHVLWCLRRGYSINPVKYAFIASSYFLWYFTAWATDSVLAYGIAHRLMHGLQYIVIVYWFLRRKGQNNSTVPDEASSSTQTSQGGLALSLAKAGRVKVFVLACVLYVLIWQLLLMRPLEVFVFGAFNFGTIYEAIPEFGLRAMDADSSYQIFATIVVDLFGFSHYYLDSFIWKVRDRDVQGGL